MVIQRNEWAEVVTGGVVLAVALLFALYALGVTGDFRAGASDVVRYRVSLVEAGGVSEGTEVRVAGVRVGRVDWVELNPATFAAETELAVDSNFEFPADSVALVSSEGLLGGTYVEIRPGQATHSLAPGDRLRAIVPETGLVDFLLQALNGRR
ncbi:MAG TPA: outer membrane lipid asymmetry maintenance protein MlaD [Maritimibacter sp.]|nr:outer membrane lipid asymmetry maintenance protein MlaD [Maritimibacter sp.]